MYKLVAEDLIDLEHPKKKWEKYFSSLAKAKKFALLKYHLQGGGLAGTPEMIDWQYIAGVWTSQDLIFIFFTIESVKLEH